MSSQVDDIKREAVALLECLRLTPETASVLVDKSTCPATLKVYVYLANQMPVLAEDWRWRGHPVKVLSSSKPRLFSFG